MGLAQLFSAKQTLRQHLARSPRRSAPRPLRRPPVFEPLEPRLLLAADPAILLPIAPSPELLLASPPVILDLQAAPAPVVQMAVPVNVDDQVEVAFSGYVLNRATGTFDTLARITNTGATPLDGPMTLVVGNLTPGVTLANAAGQTTEGQPFVPVPLLVGGLEPGATLSGVLLKFANPARARFSFSPSVFAVPRAEDGEPPMLTAALTNDTGASDADGITMDPGVAGTVTDASLITAFHAGFDATPSEEFLSILDVLAPDGSFALEAARLAQLTGGSLPDGPHTLHLRAEDASGNSAALDISFILDTTPPIVPILDLLPASDSGSDQTDNITNDATPTVRATAEAGNLIRVFVNGALGGEGSVQPFDLTLGALADGPQLVTAETVDLAGNVSVLSDLAITIDTTPPTPPAFDLTPVSDTEPVGDHQTTFPVVTLAGQTDPDTTMALLETGATTTADETGSFSFPAVGLALGPNPFTVRATDLAGNLNEFSRTITRLESGGEDVTPPVIGAALVNDTGPSDADGVTAEASVAGTITDASPIGSFLAGFGDAPSVSVLDALQANGSFILSAARLAAINGGMLPNGSHTLRLRAVDNAGNVSGIIDVAFTLDTAEPTLTVEAPADGAVIFPGARLMGEAGGTGSDLALIQYRLDAFAPVAVAFGPTGAFDQALALEGLAPGDHTLAVSATDVAGNLAVTAIDVTLGEVPFRLDTTTPLDGADGVGIGVRPTIVFSEPADRATVAGATFFAEAAGTTLPANVVVDESGRFARLFFGGPMPGGAEVRVTVDGSAILAADDGTPLDAGRDGAPGGLLTFSFTTVSTAALPGTALSGRLADAGPDLVPLTADDTLPGPDGQVGTPDDVILTPIAGARIFVRGLEDDVVLTGADGAFHLDAVPGGTVALALLGETAAAPPGFTYPEMTADLQVTVGIDNQIGTVYMPRLASAAVQTVDTCATTVLTLPPEGAAGLTEEQRQQFTLEIPPDGLLGPDGRPVGSAQVLMSVVPAGTLAPSLPPTLPEPALAFTVQLRGATDVGGPLRMTLPNLSGAPVGTEFLVVSFDPATGKLLDNGVATVAAGAGPSVLAAAGDGPGIAQVGAPIEWELTLEPGNMGVCFHFLVLGSPVSSSDCDPGVPATQFVFPAFLDEGTLKDYLFFSDSDTASLHFENAAESLDPSSEPCSPVNQKASPLKVEIRLEQPDEMPFVEPRGLADEVFFLYPQEERDVLIRLRRLLEDFNIDPATESRLLGATLSLRGTTVNPQTGSEVVVFDHDIFLYRLFDIADANHIDETLDFERTLADGADGVVRDKALRLVMPEEARPQILPAAGPFTFVTVGGVTDGVRFDPAEAGEHFGRLQVVSSNGPVGDIDLHGTAAAPQTVAFSRDVFRDALALIVDRPAGHLDEFVLTFPDSDGDRLRSDDPAFEGIVDFLYNTAVGAFENIAYSFDIFVDSATTIVDGTAGSMHITPFSTFGGGPDLAPNPGAIGSSPFVDLKLGNFDELVDNRDRTSLPGEKFLFSQLVNNSPSDPHASLGYQGAVLDLDQMTAGPFGAGDIQNGFVRLLANTMAHEIGHNLGAVHTRTGAEGYVAGDVMGFANQPLATFSNRHSAVIKMALGVPVSDEEYQATFDYYVQTIPLESMDSVPFFPGSQSKAEGPLLEAPFLDIFTGPIVLGEPLPDRVRAVDLGSTVADGPGGDSATVTLHLFSNGDRDLTIRAISLVGDGAGFSIEGAGALPLVLPPLDPDDLQPDLSTRAITLRFDPSAAGQAAQVLRIESNSLGGPIEIPLSGLGVSPVGDLVLEVRNNNLGGARVGGPGAADPDLATIRNIGAGPLTITGITVIGGGGQFTLTGLPPGLGPGNPLVLAAGGSFTFGAAFDAEHTGLQRARIEIASSDPDRPVLNQGVTGTGLADAGSALDHGQDFVAVQAGDGPVVRQVSDGGGHWRVFLASGMPFRHAEFDPVSGLIADTVDITSEVGETVLGLPVFRASTAPDSDGDGLPDDVEFAIGSAPDIVDTDADGLDDFAEIVAGGNPLDGVVGRAGVIGALQLDGEAWDIAVEGRTAYVATGDHGLAVVDISEPDRPILLGAVNLPGFNRAVDVDGRRSLAAVVIDDFVETGSLHVVDVSDPARPLRLRTVPLPDRASHVEVLDGVAFVASGTALVSVELTTGDVLQTLDLGGAALTGLAREGRTLFSMDFARTLRAVDISGGQMVAGDTLFVGDSGGEIFVGGGIAYLTPAPGGFGGFATVDVSDPDDLTLISNADQGLESRPDRAVAADGSGRALVIGDAPNPSNPFLPPINVVDVADTSDPADTDAYLARFLLPEFPLGITLASGVAFIADGPADLLVIGYRSDAAGQPPAVSITALAEDADPVAPGVQVAAGELVHVLVDASDDALVRDVELLVNGVPVATDVSFPHEALVSAAAAGPLTIQARATDIGGNVGLSNVLALAVVPDTFAPEILEIDPADGASEPEGLQRVQVRFSEALDPDTVTGGTFRVVTGGQIQAPLGIDLLAEGRLVRLRFAGLGAGDYQLVIDAADVTDRAGNPLGVADVVSAFTLTGDAVEWINPAGGFWDVAANWEGGVLPGPDDNVLIPDFAGDITITHRMGTTVINRLISRESLTLTGGTLEVVTTVQVDNNFTIGNGSTLAHAQVLPGSGGQGVTVAGSGTFDAVTLRADVTVQDMGTLSMENGLTLDGARLTLASTGSFAELFVIGDQTLGGTGEVFFGGTADDNSILQSGGTLTIGPGITIRGSQGGTVGGFGDSSLVLEGTVLAETASETITIDAAWTNAGLLRAQNGGTLELDGTLTLAGAGTFDSNGGTVRLVGVLDNTGKTLALTAATGSLGGEEGGIIKGGRITAAGGATLQISELTLDGVTLAMDLTIPDGAQLTAVNGLTLDDAVITLDDTGIPFVGPRLKSSGTQTLGGTGEIVFAGTGDNGSVAGSSFETLTIGPGITIHGTTGGSVGVLGTLINQGLIRADLGGQEIDVTGSSVTNEGGLRAINAGFILLQNFAGNTGTVTIGAGASRVRVFAGNYVQTAGGTTTIGGGTLQANLIDIQGGSLTGSGTVNGNFKNAGQLTLGTAADATGTLSVTGTFEQTATGALNLQLAGTNTADFDRLLISGAATLRGTLNVALAGGFTPSAGNAFDILTFPSHVDDFDTINLPSPNLQAAVEATRVRLTAS